MTVVKDQTDRAQALEAVRSAMVELFGAERRLRARDQAHGGLTNAQLRALLILDQHDEVTAGELAKSADLNPASVTAMLDQLESRGIIERQRAHDDRRVCMVSLTPAGREVVKERRAAWHAMWEQRLGQFSDHELMAALSVLRTMTKVIDEL